MFGMAKLKILVWESKEPSGEPTVEVTIPDYLAKWVPRMMKFIPRKTKEEIWEGDIDFKDFDLSELIKEAIEKGESEIMEVKAKDTYVKILVEL
jgi:hypothetical protein